MWGTATDLHYEKFSQCWVNIPPFLIHPLFSHQHETFIMSAYLFYNNNYNVLICKIHQCTLFLKSLTWHFLKEHDLNLFIWQSIYNYVEHYTVTKAADLTYSSETIYPIPYLSIINGFQCQYEPCHKILGTLASMKVHCCFDHEWKAKNEKHWVKIWVQTFYQENDRRYMN